jgi:hypothetical protein
MSGRRWRLPQPRLLQSDDRERILSFRVAHERVPDKLVRWFSAINMVIPASIPMTSGSYYPFPTTTPGRMELVPGTATRRSQVQSQRWGRLRVRLPA